jgi:hypothetical protein
MSCSWAVRVVTIAIGLSVCVLVGSWALPARGVDAYTGPDDRGSQPVDPFGVYFFPATTLVGGEQMEKAGASWAHFQISWRQVESNPGVYNWSRYDALLSEAASRGFSVVLLVTVNPVWAGETLCGPIYPEHIATFANFLHAAVARYSVAPYNVLYWVIYNEPDNSDSINNAWLGGCWGEGHANQAEGAGGAAYATMLSQVYPAMKAANPQVQVVLGSLAHDWFISPTGTGIFDRLFLDNVLAAGGGAFFDVLAFHYYIHFWERWWHSGSNSNYQSGIIRKAAVLQAKVVAATGAPKPILVTEVGRRSNLVSGDVLDYSEELSAQYVFQANARAMAAGIYPIIWFQAVDEPWLGRLFGLVRDDLTPKLSYSSYGVMTKELAGASFVRTRTDFPGVVEGYEFLVNGEHRTVVWLVTEASNNKSSTPTMQLAAPLSRSGSALGVTSIYGDKSLIFDGGLGDLDGARNGQVALTLGSSPLILDDLGVNKYRIVTELVRGKWRFTYTLVPGQP